MYFQFIYFYFLVTNMQALGELLEKKQPWQNIVAICTTDIWFETLKLQWPRYRSPIYYFSHTHTFFPLFYVAPDWGRANGIAKGKGILSSWSFPLFFFFMNLSVFSGNSIRLEPSWGDCSCRSACEERNWPGKSPTLQFLTSRMLFPMRDP